MFTLSKSLAKLKTLSKSQSNEGNVKTVDKIKRKKPKKVEKSEDSSVSGKGVIMVSHIPHGFYEREMFSYFSQFGKVLKIKVSKNKKTGNRRNYAFIEFDDQEVAKIAANTMNNYLMFEQILKCEFIPKDKLKEKPNLLKKWNKQFVSSTQIHKSLHNKNKLIEREFKLLRKRLKRVKQMESLLKEKGMDYKCEIINLPNFSKVREDMKQELKESNIKLKTPKIEKLISKRKTGKPSAKETVVLTPKTRSVLKPMKKLIKKGNTPKKSPIFPKLYKFSIILSANKRKKCFNSLKMK